MFADAILEYVILTMGLPCEKYHMISYWVNKDVKFQVGFGKFELVDVNGTDTIRQINFRMCDYLTNEGFEDELERVLKEKFMINVYNESGDFVDRLPLEFDYEDYIKCLDD